MSSESSAEEKEGLFSSRIINIVFITLLLDLLGFTLILPLFPSILEHYGQTEVRYKQTSFGSSLNYESYRWIPHFV